MAVATQNQNADIWGLGICLGIGAFALTGATMLAEQPAVQNLFDDGLRLVSHQIQADVPPLSPTK